MFWKIGFLEAKVGEKKTSFSANTIFEDAMIYFFFPQKYSVTSHGFVILYIIYVLYIIYNIT